jgi:hypothetical protein
MNYPGGSPHETAGQDLPGLGMEMPDGISGVVNPAQNLRGLHDADVR